MKHQPGAHSYKGRWHSFEFGISRICVILFGIHQSQGPHLSNLLLELAFTHPANMSPALKHQLEPDTSPYAPEHTWILQASPFWAFTLICIAFVTETSTKDISLCPGLLPLCFLTRPGPLPGALWKFCVSSRYLYKLKSCVEQGMMFNCLRLCLLCRALGLIPSTV